MSNKILLGDLLCLIKNKIRKLSLFVYVKIIRSVLIFFKMEEYTHEKITVTLIFAFLLFSLLFPSSIFAQEKISSEIQDEEIETQSKNQYPNFLIGPTGSYPFKLNSKSQAKHITTDSRYEAGRSVFFGNLDDADRLMKFYALKSPWINVTHKHRFSHSSYIGRYINENTGVVALTKNGIIHWGKEGGHIVPGHP